VLENRPRPLDGPTVPWLAAGFLLAGLGTAILGSILPTVAAQWHLTDSASGVLFLAKFVGAFLGGIAVAHRLRLSLLAGTLASALGFGAFAFAPNYILGAFTLLLGGFGLGLIIASTNILAGLRFRHRTGSALSALNFFFALGAVTTGLLTAALVPRFGLRTPLLIFAAAFVVCGLGGWLNPARPQSASDLASNDVGSQDVDPERKLPRATFLLFCLCLFLYGGLETSLTSWLPTFTLRYADHPLLHGQSAVVVLWTALTAGRALSSLAMRRASELTLQTLGLAASAAIIAALAFTHSAAALTAECVLLGLALAPFFPANFALLMRRRPPHRAAGFILAVSGLGAAFFPWLIGVVSTHANLRLSMLLPAAIALALLFVGRLPAVADR
jgi:fucose permease